MTRVVLANHSDFQEQKTEVETYMLRLGYQVLFIPKFHSELNPIERVWGQAKVYTRKFINFSLIRLRKIPNPALDSVSTDTIRKYFRKIQEHEGPQRRKQAGREVEQEAKLYKLQRRVVFSRNLLIISHCNNFRSSVFDMLNIICISSYDFVMCCSLHM